MNTERIYMSLITIELNNSGNKKAKIAFYCVLTLLKSYNSPWQTKLINPKFYFIANELVNVV